MRSSWCPGLGAALFVGALVHLAGCNAAESLLPSSRGVVSKDASIAAPTRSLIFRESALDVGERARNWRATAGVDVGTFASKKRHGVTFVASAGSRVRARTGALPGTFGRATKAKVRLSVRNASESHPVTVRFDFVDAAGTTRWSQPVTFTDSRWKTVTMRLSKDKGFVSMLSPLRDVSSWGMTFSDGAEVQVQRFELWRHGAPEVSPLNRALIGLVVGEPAAMQASREATSAWLRGESVVRLDNAFDGLVSLHRQMSSTFPGAPDLEKRAPITASVWGGAQTLWQLAESAMGRAPQTAHRSRFPEPQRPAVSLPWVAGVSMFW